MCYFSSKNAAIQALLLFITSLSCAAGKQVDILYDGVNRHVFIHDSIPTHLHADDFIFGNSTVKDSFDAKFIIPDSSLAAAWVSLGAETGDLLLNGAGSPREHRTDLGIKTSIFDNKVSLYGRYLHDGNFADQYYARRAQLGTVPEQNLNHQALLMEYYGGMLLNLHDFSLDVDFSKTGQWGLTPYHFSPLFRSGYALQSDAAFSNKKFTSHLRVESLLFDYFYEFVSSKNERFFRVNSKNHYQLKESISTYLNLTVDNAYVNSSAAWAGSHLHFDKLHSDIGIGFTHDKNPQARFNLAYNTRDYLTFRNTLSYQEHSRKPDITYRAFDDTVTFTYHTINFWREKATIELGNLEIFPLSFDLWAEYISNSRQLSAANDTLHNEIQIAATSATSLASIGFSTSAMRQWSAAKIEWHLHAQKEITSGREPIEIPWNTALELYLGNSGTHTIKGKIRLGITGPITYTFVDFDGQGFERRIKERVDLDVSSHIPFISPIFTKQMQPEFVLSVNSLNLLGEKRMRFHPEGNEAGMKIEAIMIVRIKN
ncbi:MAG: hypothetical protein GF398_11550 [Chitinivibrionales bacterium]|nr:hypothetical protein [Chitinivibrionales bacterium]